MKKLILSITTIMVALFFVACSTTGADENEGGGNENVSLTSGTATGSELSGTWSTATGDTPKAGDVTFSFLSESEIDFYYTNDAGETSVLKSSYVVATNNTGSAADGFNDTLKLLDAASSTRAVTYAFIYVFTVDPDSKVSFKLIENSGVKVDEVAVSLVPFDGTIEITEGGVVIEVDTSLNIGQYRVTFKDTTFTRNIVYQTDADGSQTFGEFGTDSLYFVMETETVVNGAVANDDIIIEAYNNAGVWNVVAQYENEVETTNSEEEIGFDLESEGGNTVSVTYNLISATEAYLKIEGKAFYFYENNTEGFEDSVPATDVIIELRLDPSKLSPYTESEDPIITSSNTDILCKKWFVGGWGDGTTMEFLNDGRILFTSSDEIASQNVDGGDVTTSLISETVTWGWSWADEDSLKITMKLPTYDSVTDDMNYELLESYETSFSIFTDTLIEFSEMLGDLKALMSDSLAAADYELPEDGGLDPIDEPINTVDLTGKWVGVYDPDIGENYNPASDNYLSAYMVGFDADGNITEYEKGYESSYSYTLSNDTLYVDDSESDMVITWGACSISGDTLSIGDMKLIPYEEAVFPPASWGEEVVAENGFTYDGTFYETGMEPEIYLEKSTVEEPAHVSIELLNKDHAIDYDNTGNVKGSEVVLEYYGTTAEGSYTNTDLKAAVCYNRLNFDSEEIESGWITNFSSDSNISVSKNGDIYTIEYFIKDATNNTTFSGYYSGPIEALTIH
jgi:hypothetical protein